MWPVKASSGCVAGMTDVCGLPLKHCLESLLFTVWGFKCGGRTCLIIQTIVSMYGKKNSFTQTYRLQLRHQY